ncbi:MAG TPA: hypothetical protein VF432_13730 [Thermoanaerobaculia bacterium]
MKTVAWIFASLPFVVACSRGTDHPLTAACKPVVSVTVPAATGGPKKGPAAAVPPPRQEVVQVYWDVSRSMRDFSATRKGSDGEAWTDDLTPVVTALDSSVLLRAHATAVEQYGVGESIRTLPSARAALHPVANRTALHLAAEQIGTALAGGAAQAALVVSDMELDTPPGTASGATVCRGVPLPGTPQAGSLFGRCLETAVLTSKTPALTRTNLLVHVFRKGTHGRELYILLLATDRVFGRRISDEVVRRLDFSRHVIFDSGAVAASNVRGCRLTAPVPGMLRTLSGCAAKCFDDTAAIQSECDIRRVSDDAWIYPAGRGLDGVQYDSLPKNAGDVEEQAFVRFRIPCNVPPGRFDATVSFTWRARNPWLQKNAAFTQNPGVRDLFDSLTDAIVRTAAPRKLRIGIKLAK